MINNPTPRKVVTLEQLEQLAAHAPQPVTINLQDPVERGSIIAPNSQDWFDQWCKQNDPAITPQFHPYNGGRLARVPCPWNPEHGRDAYVLQQSNGAIAAGCHHASCQDKKWPDYRAAKEPGYKPGQAVGANPALANAVKSALSVPIQWAAPMPLPLYLKPELPRLDKALIPAQFLAYCADVAYRKQAPIEYVIISFLVTVSCLLGNKCGIYGKQQDNWVETANIWAMLIGKSGRLKSPVINEVMLFLRLLEDEFKREYEKAMRQNAASIKALENQINTANQVPKLKKTPPTPTPTPTSLTQQQLDLLQVQLDDLKANPPKVKRRIVKDTTIEKLQMILSENPEGCLLLWDELSAFFNLLEKQGNETARGFLLEAWNGSNSYTVDRVSRASFIIDNLCLSIFGTIQPDVLMEYARQSIKKHGSDGFLSRFQLYVFPPRGTWKYNDTTPDPQAKQLIEAITGFLSVWRPHDDPHGTEYRRDTPGKIGVYFDAEAQALFVRWYSELQERIYSDKIESPRMEEHLSKYPALMLKLSLIFHCAEHAIKKAIPAKINKLTAARAIGWCEYLEPHAERLYDADKAEQDEIVKAALALLEKIKNGQVTAGMTISQISQKGWSGLKDVQMVADSITVLDEQGWVRMVPKNNSTGGRPTQGIVINPNAMQYLQNRAHYVTEIPVDERPRPWLDHLKSMLEPQPSVDWIMTLQYWQDIMEMDSYEADEEDDLDAYGDMEAQAALFMLL